MMNNKKIRAICVAIVLAAGFTASAAQATNLVTNGGFETGDFTGWNVNANATAVLSSGADGINAESGTFFAILGDTASFYPFGTLSQSVNDVAGESLQLSYSLISDGALPNYFDATWNGATIAGSVVTNVSDQRPDGWVHYTFNVLGTGSDTLLFHEQNIPAYLGLDNVSVSGTGVGAAPEPATWAIMMFGLGVVGMRQRGAKRRNTQPAFAAA